MLDYWFTEQLPATIAIMVWFTLWFAIIIHLGNLAWRYPTKLKDKYVVQTERWPKWVPFRNYYLRRYSSNAFVWEVRIITLLGGLIPLGLLVITILGLLFGLTWIGLQWMDDMETMLPDAGSNGRTAAGRWPPVESWQTIAS